MNDHIELDDLDALALGTLASPGLEKARAHLDFCSECRRAYGDVRSVLDVLPYGLPEIVPRPSLHAGLLERIGGGSAPAPQNERRGALLPAALAAGLLLALAGNLWLGWRLQHQATSNVVIVQRHAPTTSAPRSLPRLAPAAPPPHAVSSPAISASAAAQTPTSAAPIEDALRKRIAADNVRISELQNALERETVLATSATNAERRATAQSSPPPSAQLVAALSSGRVYGVDGSIGNQPWHLTIVQPPAGGNALIFSQVPSAPNGQTYRAWVVRGGKTFDAGALPAGSQTELEMPMPLENGDVVAFSREPVGEGGRPTSPFLMQVTIAQ